jgi:hypothetical protein
MVVYGGWGLDLESPLSSHRCRLVGQANTLAVFVEKHSEKD